MKVTKKKLDDIKRCYAVSSINYEGKNHYIFGSEDKNVICESFSGEDFKKDRDLWREPGGCMSIIGIPNREGEILAIQEFYLKVSPSLSKVVWGKYKNGTWEFKDIIKMPYIHRFDIYNLSGVNYFIGATIADEKNHKEDWSHPGTIYLGELKEDGLELKPIKKGLFRNHGYYRDYDGDKVVGYFSSDEGVYKVTPHEDFKIEKIMDGKIGEIAVIDIDGDGEKEIMTIEPFHGDKMHIYKKIKGSYKRVYTYENDIEFAHALIAGCLRGTPSFIAGVRRKDAELIYIQFKDGKFITNLIDKGVGPANLCLVNEGHRDLILSANHTSNEACIYVIED